MNFSNRPLILLIVFSIPCFTSIGKADNEKTSVKNVLFIISDDLKASVLGCYGDKVCKTPNIDALAQRAMVFDRTYCQGVVCGPSRKSFMFSRYTGDKGISLGEHLQNHDVYSARVGKIFHMRVPGDIIAGTNGVDYPECWTERFNSPGREAHTPGDYACLNLNIFTDALENRQSTKMPHRMFVSVQYDGDGSDQPDHKSATKAMELLAKHKDKRFFLAVGLVRPHYPMVAPRQYFEPYPWSRIDLPEVPDDDLSDIPAKGLAGTRNGKNPIGQYPDNQKRMWSAYYASVTFMDEQVGRILAELDRLGLRDDTAVIFTSDHGYHLGEHTFWQKNNLHEDVIRVPLIVSVPGMKAGRSESISELVDLYPTVTDLMGLETPSSVQGKSLVPILKDSTVSIRDAALSLTSGHHSLRSLDWHYMRYKDGSEELYNVNTDPKEFMNLAGVKEYEEVNEAMRSALESRLRQVK